MMKKFYLALVILIIAVYVQAQGSNGPKDGSPQSDATTANQQSIIFQSSQPQIFNSNKAKDENSIWEQWKELNKKYKFNLIIFLVVGVFIFGVIRLVITGNQFSNSEYTLIKKINIGNNAFIEERKKVNNGEIYYFAYGNIQRELKGVISKKQYEILIKNSIK